MYPPPNIVTVIKPRRMRWAEHVACRGEKRNSYMVLVGKLEGNRRLGRSMHRWENIKMNVRDVKVRTGFIWLK
jgi:hypothetical protein